MNELITSALEGTFKLTLPNKFVFLSGDVKLYTFIFYECHK